MKKNYGETHYLVVDTYATISDILYQQGRVSEAEEYRNKARDAKRKKLGLGGDQNTLFSAIQSRKGWHTAQSLKDALKLKVNNSPSALFNNNH